MKVTLTPAERTLLLASLEEHRDAVKREFAGPQSSKRRLLVAIEDLWLRLAEEPATEQ